jgi:rRNA maturation protein Rpf1
MFITTSKRPSHRSRILGRELADVIFKSEYLPRGTKTVEQLVVLAEPNHQKIIVINSTSDQPKELAFIEIDRGWRWSNFRILLDRVELQRDLGQRVKLDVAGVSAEDKEATEFTEILGSLMGLQVVKQAKNRATAIITSGEKPMIQFWTGKNKVGPKIYVGAVEKLDKVDEER